jgi:hypothetical protein
VPLGAQWRKNRRSLRSCCRIATAPHGPNHAGDGVGHTHGSRLDSWGGVAGSLRVPRWQSSWRSSGFRRSCAPRCRRWRCDWRRRPLRLRLRQSWWLPSRTHNFASARTLRTSASAWYAACLAHGVAYLPAAVNSPQPTHSVDWAKSLLRRTGSDMRRAVGCGADAGEGAAIELS